MSGGSHPRHLPEVTPLLGLSSFSDFIPLLFPHLPWERVLNEPNIRQWREPVTVLPSLQPTVGSGMSHWLGEESEKDFKE